METSQDSRELTPAEQLRQAMRRMASSVAILTACYEAKPRAMTITSLTSVSFDPPSLLVCVNRDASIHSALMVGRHFAVNLLSQTNTDVSLACSGRVSNDNRFATGSWKHHQDEPPQLVDAQAVIQCVVDQQSFYGTHSILVGRVLSARVQGALDPLIYLDGRYVRFQA